MLNDFKKFALRGNVMDLAIGIIIGGAFGKIITSFVNDVIMPLLGLLVGGVDFTNLFISLDGSQHATLQAAKDAGAATLNYGLFISAIFDFVIIALSIFLVISQLSKLKKKEEPVVEDPTTKQCVFCKTEISLEATRCPYCTSVLD